MTTKTDTDYVYATDFRQLRENWIVGVPDIFTEAGQLVVGLGADSAGLLSAGCDWRYLMANSAKAEGMEFVAMGLYIADDTGTYPSGNFAEATLIVNDKTVQLVAEYIVDQAGVYYIQACSINGGYDRVWGDIYYLASQWWKPRLYVTINSTSYNISIGQGQLYEVVSGARILELSAGDQLKFYRDSRGGWNTSFVSTSQIAIIRMPGNLA